MLVCEGIQPNGEVETMSDEKTCIFEEWQDGTFDSIWNCSNCKEDFCFIEGDPKDNLYRYCPNCGAKITEYKEFSEDSEDMDD